jgi:drug/metabolite transporter (DMT)-like permease
MWGKGELTLLVVAALWGTTFVVVKGALGTWPPFALLAGRFLLATLVLAPVLVRPAAWKGGAAWRGAVLGALFFVGFGLQTLGLAITTPARSAFYTSLSVPMVPVLGIVLLRRSVRSGTLLAMGLGAAGAFLLSGRGVGDDLRTGDLLTVASAGAFALQILLLGEFTRRSPVAALAGVEFATAALLFTVAALVLGQGPPPGAASHPGAILYLGLVATALTLFLQMVGQRWTTANRAAFVLALEPVFATLFAWLARGDRLAPSEIGGGVLIVSASLAAGRRIARRGAGSRAPSAPGLPSDGELTPRR